jgi:NADH dehydrogenase [ubiquinone] 1 alpha subcomplex assembly factor 7
MSFARYMELALQHPQYGYYRHGNPLGNGGDFITAPEISQIFGELIGLCIAEAWKAMDRPEAFLLFELGPGRGTLMQDALRATAKIHGFHAAMKLRLLESNETLRSQQRVKLAACGPEFVTELSFDGDMLPAFVVANEFFDALPVRLFEKAAEGWRERLVGLNGEELVFVLSPPDPAFLLFIPPDLREAPVGTVHESSLSALNAMRLIARYVAQHGGAALVIDYGYGAPPGKPTVQAASKHSHADILERPGEVDLTAHVDFAALRQMAQLQEAKIFGPVGQGEFLQTLGIETRAAQLKHVATPAQAEAIDAAVKRLTDAGEMGALFKAMGVASPELRALAGF